MSSQQSSGGSPQKTKITLYWLEKSRAHRILWLLEELKVEYELKTYKRIEKQAPPELKKIHPLGKAPIVSIQAEGASEPLILAESGPIVEYLIDHFRPDLAPKKYQDGKENQIQGESEEWMRYRYYMHSVEGSLMPVLLIAIFMSIIKNGAPFFIRPITNAITGKVDSMFLSQEFRTHFGFLESQIKSAPNGGGFLCGSKLTGADMLMSFPLGAARGRFGFTQEKYPGLWAYVDRLQATESFQRASQKIVNIEGSYDPTF